MAGTASAAWPRISPAARTISVADAISGKTSQTGNRVHKAGSNVSTETHPSAPARLIVAAAIVLVGITLGVNTGGTIVTLAIAVTAYLLLLVGVAWATRERRHGIALATTALVVGLVSALLAPLTWGVSLFQAALVLPLAVPGLMTPGRARWLAVLALLLNAALTVLLVLIWFV